MYRVLRNVTERINNLAEDAEKSDAERDQDDGAAQGKSDAAEEKSERDADAENIAHPEHDPRELDEKPDEQGDEQYGKNNH